jgi:hypothetical protein
MTSWRRLHPSFDLKGKTVFIAGHRLVDSAILRRLRSEACSILRLRGFDLTRQQATERNIRERKPDVIIVATGLAEL